MFDVSWSEFLIVGIVALLVVGPKEMPTLLRTVGKYVGMIRRQAAEFRAQFDEAMREAELDQLRKEMEAVKTDAEGALRQASDSVTREVDDARRALDDAAASTSSDPALPAPSDQGEQTAANGNDAGASETTSVASEPRPEGTAAPKTPV